MRTTLRMTIVCVSMTGFVVAGILGSAGHISLQAYGITAVVALTTFVAAVCLGAGGEGQS
ncbi:MAG TPA: hypothetical protein VGL13_00685 [Polyangiaceae bacterium]